MEFDRCLARLPGCGAVASSEGRPAEGASVEVEQYFEQAGTPISVDVLRNLAVIVEPQTTGAACQKIKPS